jgi:transposase
MAMDRASWHTGEKAKKRENSVPLFQPPQSPELNPVEQLWHSIREKENFKNHTSHSLSEVEMHLTAELKKLFLDFETAKKITQFTWIKNRV